MLKAVYCIHNYILNLDLSGFAKVWSIKLILHYSSLVLCYSFKVTNCIKSSLLALCNEIVCLSACSSGSKELLKEPIVESMPSDEAVSPPELAVAATELLVSSIGGKKEEGQVVTNKIY